MRGINDKIIEMLRRDYPAGTRVVLRRMDDPQAPPIGTKGTVIGVDDIGSLLVKWDNGSGLNVAYGADYAEKLDSVKVTCYGETKIWDSRKEAADFYLSAIAGSEGSECERYTKIYTDLVSGKKECSDTEE